MRVAYFSTEGITLSWARRLIDEGCEVLVYVSHDRKNVIGKGIVHLATSKAQWIHWAAQDPNTLYFFDCTDEGMLADQLRNAGKHVLNGGSFQDRLEKDRGWGVEIVKKAGVKVPPTYNFSSISQVEAFLAKKPAQAFGDGGWAWKPDKDIGCDATLVAKDDARILDHVNQIRRRFGDNLKCILQEKIDGVAVSTARWWNGAAWVGPIEGTIENKKLMDGDKGPATGCSFNVVWFYWDNNVRIAKELAWEKLAAEFRQKKAPAGLYDINCILNKKGAWFLEWTPRLGVDSEITSQRGIKNLSKFLWAVVTRGSVDEYFDKNQCYFDVRLSVPPYPVSADIIREGKSPAIGVPVKGMDGLWENFFVMGGLQHSPTEGFSVAEPGGMLGYYVTAGNSMKKAYEKLYEHLDKNLIVPDLQYRTDAAKVLQSDIDKMKSFGFETTPALKA